ncbi:DMT family transporter [Clostridium beijerinckii]|uniref:Multidrug resistance efflux transporter family protein n=1 Tax=Clostridium beijerinckii TaxID=1520 RepID=A0A1S9N913_CLOBE|nr:multidrug resistance efflux transporter family protein [Clostridium beijerinckii]MZK49373.1 EamA family transporter [Clostridium beijerinckii]MZK57464.1 EamA family transporter [Clostridium beijerinckii]MZK67675.1 EamA family transporter [Clostridium beijerinckii]MZK73042.1 EamA family transporter [Clostridium beijerinckii]MZK82755.1 EamA family transporter [Clostridium beijerinckii]
MTKALILGIAASFFFAFTFILNQQMNISGGSFLWSSSLRYIFMLPLLLIIMIINRQLNPVLNDIINKPIQWITWSTIGFGLFYTPLSFASTYGASWLVAGTWQLTIVAGALMSPLFFKSIKTPTGICKVRNTLPKKSLLMSSLILLGIFLMQFEEAKSVSFSEIISVIIPVILAAFAYPLGNRKMMEICNDKFNTFQRVFGMTLCSMPFWILISIFGVLSAGMPSKGQVLQSLIVAIFSGIIATILFFKATDIVSNDTHKLAVVESTQSGEVIFTLIGGVFIFHDKCPTFVGLAGIVLIVIGMILNSIVKS